MEKILNGRLKVRFSLTGKLILAVSLLVGLVVSLFGFIDGMVQKRIYNDHARRQRENGLINLKNQGRTLTRRLATALAPAIAELNYPYIHEIVESTLIDDENILYVIVTDRDGAVVVDSRLRSQGKPLRSGFKLEPPKARIGQDMGQDDIKRDRRSLRFKAPLVLGNATRGEIQLAFSLAFLDHQVAMIIHERKKAFSSLIVRSVSLGGMCLLVGILLSVFLAMSITRSLKSLSYTANQLARGDMSARANLRSKDEIGQLGLVFNDMAEQLKSLLAETKVKVELEKEMEVARALQNALIPSEKVIEIGRLEVAGFYRPARICGGDWWSYFNVIDDQICIVIGDVTGHGIPAAMITASSKGACDTLYSVLGPQLKPIQLMQVLNHVIYTAGNRQFLMTCFITIIDVKTREIQFANAGHPMPYICRAIDGKIELDTLKAYGNQLGDLPTWDFPLAQAQLRPGDVFLWYTDGLNEGENPKGEWFGERRIRKTLQRVAKENVVEMREEIVKSAYSFYQNQPQEDDITFVLAKYDGKGE